MNNCVNCEKRYLGCHDNCDKYKNFKIERELANNKAREMNSSIGWDGYLKVKERIRR